MDRTGSPPQNPPPQVEGAVAVRPTRSRKPVDMEAVIQDFTWETHDSVTLVLSVDGPIEYQAGQFLNIDPRQFGQLAQLIAYLEHLKGKKELVRAYSLCSAPHEPYVAITFKEERFVPGETRYPPLLTPLLARGLSRGSRLRIHGFTGAYVLPEDAEAQVDHILHVVAGSGVVPSFSLLKDSLHRGRSLKHTFVYSNKTWKDVYYRSQLEALERAHPDKLRLIHTLTREEDLSRFGPNVRRGRVTPEFLRELVPDPSRCLAYVCGPAINSWDRKAALETGIAAKPRFLEMVISYLHDLGFARHQIKRESWG